MLWMLSAFSRIEESDLTNDEKSKAYVYLVINYIVRLFTLLAIIHIFLK